MNYGFYVMFLVVVVFLVMNLKICVDIKSIVFNMFFIWVYVVFMYLDDLIN